MLRAPIFGAKNNFAATVDPTVGDDLTIGYAVGSEWLRADTDELFVCFDNSAGAAVWREVGVGGGGGTHVDTVDPTVTDDTTKGYDPGSLWLNTTTKHLWVCIDASTGAAVWDDIKSDDTLVFTFLNNGAVLNTGPQSSAYLEIPFDCTVLAVRMYGAPSGDIQVDLWNDSYSNYPPDVADTIVAAAPPKIVTAVKSEDTTLTGWTTALAAGSGVLPNIDSVTSMTWAKLVLQVERR